LIDSPSLSIPLRYIAASRRRDVWLPSERLTSDVPFYSTYTTNSQIANAAIFHTRSILSFDVDALRQPRAAQTIQVFFQSFVSSLPNGSQSVLYFTGYPKNPKQHKEYAKG
jgi:hypothetical protein